MRLEICVESPQGLAAAEAAGADRVELCAGLDLGGLTPGAGLLAAASRAGVPAHVLIRPRAGDFRADKADLAAMRDDIAAVRAAGLAGVVIGVSGPDGALDRAAMAALVAAAGPLAVTLHRAIDLTPEPLAALELAVELGIGRILSSGGAPTAPEGTAGLAALVQAASGRIEIMAGGGVTAAAAPALLATGVDALHASCSRRSPANDAFGFGATRATDPALIGALKRAMEHEDAVQ